MSLGMLILVALAIIIGIVAMRLAWRLVNKMSTERPKNDDQ